MNIKDPGYRTGLYGAMGNSVIRHALLGQLALEGVNTTLIHNPQLPVGTWNNEEAGRIEDAVKESGIPLLFMVDTPNQEDRTSYSGLAVVQAFESLINPKYNTLIHFDLAGLDRNTAKAYKKIIRDLAERWPNAIVGSWREFVDACIDNYWVNPNMRGVLLGTGGTNDWPTRLIGELTARNEAEPDTRRIDLDQFINPFVEPGSWKASGRTLEERVIRQSTHHIFFIGNPGEKRSARAQVPVYSLLEIMESLYAGRDIAVYFNFRGMEDHGLEVAKTVHAHIRQHFPDTPVFEDELEAAKDWLKAQL